jgi:hypothetical protein
MQNMTRGNLYLNLTFNVVEGNITVKAEINTDSYNPDAFLALQFDSDGNGTIDLRYWPKDNTYIYHFGVDDSQFLLRVNNYTTPSEDVYWGWLLDGTIYFSRILPMGSPKLIASPFHYCIFEGGIYTFFFTFPRSIDFNAGWPYIAHAGIQGKLVRALFGIEPPSSLQEPEKDMAVYAPPFDFVE